MTICKVWLTPTPSAALYTPRLVDRSGWQHRVELPVRITEFTQPLGQTGLRNPSRRNYGRLLRRIKALVNDPKPRGYPATAGTEPHWADVSGLETVEDRRRAKNAMRRRKQGRK